jgi:hypothetical protein
MVTATVMHNTYTGTRTMPNKDQGIAIRRRRNFGGVHVSGASIKRDGFSPKQTLQMRTQSNAAVQQATTSGKLDGQKHSSRGSK